MSPSLTFVKQATWIGQGLLRLMRPRSRSLRSIFLIGASICMGNSLLIDRASFPRRLPTAGVYNDNFRAWCPIVRLPVERPMAPCSDLSYATTRSPLILAGMCLTVPHNTLTWGLLTPAVPRVSAS
ncbi:hypothetical protein Salat_2963600 [Sesamum alatum]|uniref:Uncharacterized protein n=1 Tax=Sesamum alatum TaxID=300844 RepID=A0AAE1XI52_9LAMI|nr:hypothetical protein Salat_2963600 [Sesamum alatum]